MHQPFFSIITVTYNSEKYLKDCILSVMSQSCIDYEHIIVDGFSNDSTPEIINYYRKHFSIVISEPDDGLYFAMNKGISSANGKFVIFLNSDDMFASPHVLQYYKLIASSCKSIKFFFADVNYIHPESKRVKRKWRSHGFTIDKLKFGEIPAHPACLIDTQSFKEGGQFNTLYKFAADADFIIRFLVHLNFDFVYCPFVSHNMRLGGITNNSFSTIFAQNYEIFQSLRSYGVKFSPLVFIILKFISRFSQRF